MSCRKSARRCEQFPSQKGKTLTGSDHFWKLRCRKSPRRCGAKHISKSKCTRHTNVGRLLEGAMSKKCTSLWREAHFQVKWSKNHMFGPLFDVQMSKKCAPLRCEAHFRVKSVKKLRVLSHFLTFRCRKSGQRLT